jgi:hypothetical protein
MSEVLGQMGVEGYNECPVYGGPRIGRGPFRGGMGLGAPTENEDGSEMVAGLGKTVIFGSLIAFGVWFFLLRK